FLLNLPFFIKPNFSGLINHVKRCAEITNIPIIIYYVPSRSGQYLNIETLNTILNAHENIIGIKFADNNLEQVSYLSKNINKYVLCGEDYLLEEFIKLGASGAISVVSNALPKLTKQIFDEVRADSCLPEVLNAYNKLSKDLFLETNPILIKYLLSLLKLDCGETRPPLDKANSVSKKEIVEDVFILKQNKIIK
ncbi:MAG: dihydrodipicolinate synthase family protein, partial [Clostridia bacterium]|nr:dihydrodipicolinate synthase family protein [Clostridia bacterium]